MQPVFNPQQPIFVSIAQWLEDAILAGIYNEETQVPSITEISIGYNINPATALKGVNILVDAGLLYKKRGLGMFVSVDARAKLLARRQQQFYEDYVQPLIREANRLEIGSKDLQTMIERAMSETCGSKPQAQLYMHGAGLLPQVSDITIERGYENDNTT